MNTDQTRAMTIAGWTLTGLLALFLLFDAGMKLAAARVVLETSAQMGWPATGDMARLLGAILLGGTLLHLWPRTALLGALLLTAYLGGTVATHLRIGDPLASHTLFGVYLGIMLWAGLWLRDPCLRGILPLSSD